MYTPLNKEQYAVNLRATVKLGKLSETESIAALQRAWVNTRFQHPMIAVTDDGNNLVYEVPDSTKLSDWIRKSFLVHKGEKVTEFLLAALLQDYQTLHYFPETSEILMRTHHLLTDGIGAVCLLDRFLTYLSADETLPIFGSEQLRLAPSHTEAAGISTVLSPSAEATAEEVFISFVTKMPSVGLPILPLSKPGGTKVFTLASPLSTLPKLLAAVRKHKLGVAAAVQSAIILVTHEMAPPALAKRDFSTIAYFSHREYLPNPYSDMAAWPMGLWMIGLPLSQPQADFATTANNMQAVYGQDLGIDTSSTFEWYSGFSARMAKLLASPMPDNVPPPTQPQLSSIGLLDGKVKAHYEGKVKVEVESLEPIVDMMAAQIVVYQWYEYFDS